MRRCTSCFRFYPGNPIFCSYCGRSFDVRICSRGHRNPRGAQFCTECGSADLSTPTPPASLLHRLSGAVLYLFVALFLCLVMVSIVFSVLESIDWSRLSGPMVSLLLMLGFLYWTTTLLPGPVKKVGKLVGRSAWKVVRNKERK